MAPLRRAQLLLGAVVAGRFADAVRLMPDRATGAASELLEVDSTRANETIVRGNMNFLFLGDYGSRMPAQFQVAESMARVAARTDPLAIIGLGDNIYPDGAEGDLQTIVTWWADVYLKHPSLRRPWFPILGNHDWRSDGRVDVAFTASQLNMERGGHYQMPHYWYKRSYRNAAGASVDFFMVDTMIIMEAARVARQNIDVLALKSEQMAWLERELGASRAQWKLVCGHYPIYNPGRFGIEPTLLRDLDPLMRRHGVQIYFQAHDHDKSIVGYEGMHYVLSGAGGHPERGRNPFGAPPDTVLGYFPTNGFVGMQFDGNRPWAELTFYGPNGEVEATYRVQRDVRPAILTNPWVPPVVVPLGPALVPGSCDTNSVSRRRRAEDMCACRRRTHVVGGSDFGFLPQGWACSGNDIGKVKCSEGAIRRRRQEGGSSMCSCRRRSSNPADADYGDLPEGWVCTDGGFLVNAEGDLGDEEPGPKARQTALEAFNNDVRCGDSVLQGVELPCSEDGCTVVADMPTSETCRDFCSASGLTCVDGWAGQEEWCNKTAPVGCDQPAGATSSTICQCAPLWRSLEELAEEEEEAEAA